MVMLDGKALAEKILAVLKDEYDRLPKKPALAAVVVGGDTVVRKFIERKKNIARELGVDFRVYDYPVEISTNELRKRIATVVHDTDPTGLIIQLPLPPHVNQQYILNAVPPGKDVDVLSARAVGDFAVGKSDILPPVVAAVKALLEEYRVDYRAKHVLVLGAGTLVGRPVVLWLANEKISFTLADEHTRDLSTRTKQADIIISGVGKPGIVNGGMVQEGAVVLDAGTSESAGKLVGDIDFDSVSKKAAYLTPVPGGVGPLTVAMVYRNLLTLASARRSAVSPPDV